jgi:hypothetical protein
LLALLIATFFLATRALCGSASTAVAVPVLPTIRLAIKAMMA